MSKQTKRFAPYAGVAVVVALILVLSPLAWTDPAGGGDPPGPPVPVVDRADAGMAVREAMGFGPGEVLPAMAGDGNHRLIIQAAVQFADTHQAQLAQRVERQRAATAELVERITWNQPATEAYGEFHAARDALAEIGQTLLADLEAHLPPDAAPLASMARANRHLDRDLRTLDLAPQQRQAIAVAQRARDAVTENARYWYNAAARAEARADFELDLDNILTPAQRGLLTATRQLLTHRAQAMAIAETEAPGGA